MESWRVGLIGCGGVAKVHAQGWQATGACDMVACCDLDPAVAEQFAVEHGILRSYPDAATLLAAEPLDIVSVCTWPGTHAATTVAAAAAGARAVLCEKPMARSLAECDAMIEACDAAGTKLAIAHQHRFRQPNTTIRQLLADGAIGTPTLVHNRIEGGLCNNGSHLIDRTLWWLGAAPVWVMAQIERKTNRYERKEPIEDRTAAVIAFENGARYVLETDTPATGIGSEVFIHGTAGMLRLANYTELSRLSGSGWSPITPLPDTNQFDELLGWLRGQTEHRNAAVRSRQTIELMLAIYESVRTRGVVELPLTNPANPLRQLIDGERLPLTDTEPYDIRLPN